MDAITVRQLPDGVKHQLRLRAAAHGRSMEAEARSILVTALTEGRVVDLTWVERLVAAGDEHGGDPLPTVSDDDAPAAAFEP